MKALRKAGVLVGPAIFTGATIIGAAFLFEGTGARVAFALVPVTLIAIFVVYEGFFLRGDYLARWTKAHGIEITPENRDVLLRYLRRGRSIRATGAFAGYATYVILLGVIAGNPAGWGWLGATFGGYLLGAAVAEFWAFRSQPGAPRVASLAPRQIPMYVPRVAVVLMRIVSLAIVAFAIAWPYIPKGHPVFRGDRLPARPDLVEALAWTGIALVLLALVELTARRIVRRPQPAVSEAFVEADDAIRSTAMHGVVGAGLALQFGILSRQAGEWTMFTSGGDWHALLGFVSLLAGIAAIFSWLHLGVDQKWVVRRSRRQEVAA